MSRELAPSTSGFVILVESATHQSLLPGLTGVLYSPGEGAFSFERDRAKIASVMVQLIWSKLHYLLAKGDLHEYRFLLNQQAVRMQNLHVDLVELQIPGFHTELDPFLEPEPFQLAKFVHQNGFKDIATRDAAGWTPLCYAAINGSPSLVSSMLRLRADANERMLRGMPEAHKGSQNHDSESEK